jgi:hypothetical protein
MDVANTDAHAARRARRRMSGLGYAVLHGRLFIFGGEVAPVPPNFVYPEVEAYDPATDR